MSFQIQGTRDNLAENADCYDPPLLNPPEELVKRMTRDAMIGMHNPRIGLQKDLLEALDQLMPNQEIRTNKIS